MVSVLTSRYSSDGRATTTMKKATTTMKKTKSGSKEGKGGDSPSQLIDARIKELSDWRGEALAWIRILIRQAAPEVVEERKRRGIPVCRTPGSSASPGCRTEGSCRKNSAAEPNGVPS